MSFQSGKVSFRRFAVLGGEMVAPEQELLDKLAEHRFLTHGGIGVVEEVEYGWTGGKHIDDGDFSFKRSVFNDAISFALRIDTNKVPGAVKKSMLAVEEEAAVKSNPSGFLSKAQKKQARQTVNEKMEVEMRTGKHCRTKVVEVLWDVPGKTVYAAASGSALEKLTEIFERTFGMELSPITAGTSARKVMPVREYEDIRPTAFSPSAEADLLPEYPWIARGPEPKDFTGNEFLMWLWNEADAGTSVIPTKSAGEVTLFIDKILDLDCVYGTTGKDAVRGDGVSRMPESRAALREGKVPRKMGLILHASEQYELTLSAETLAVSAGKLPDVEDAETPRVLFEERITRLRDLSKIIDGLFEAFAGVRLGPSWAAVLAKISAWIDRSSAVRKVANGPEAPVKNSGKYVTTADGRKITAHEMMGEIATKFA